MATETREDIPLKKEKKKKRFNLCSGDFLGGPKLINCSLAILTVAVTVALIVQIHYGDYQVIPHGSVATDSKDCSIVGTEILKQGGNAVDAAVASTFCLCVLNPHTTSLDGQGEVIIYNHRESDRPTVVTFNKNSVAVASVPNLVTGLAYLYFQYCKLPWKTLVEPSIHLARNGFHVSHSLAVAVVNLEAVAIFGLLNEGDLIKMETLGDSLENIASLMDEELQKLILPQYQPDVSAATNATFKYYNVFVPDGISTGHVLLHTLKRIQQEMFSANNSQLVESEYVPILANITKAVYMELNISNFFYEGTTSNVAVMDDDDLYVSLVMGLHAPFGSRILTKGGYLLDVKTETLSPSRFPVLITDKDFICGRRAVFGVSDYIMAVQVIGHLLSGTENVTTSIEAPRFDIITDGSIGLEDMRPLLFSDDTTRDLYRSERVVLMHEPYNSCNIVEKTADTLSSHSDSRGGGLASRF